jgi:hypothetical protein
MRPQNNSVLMLYNLIYVTNKSIKNNKFIQLNGEAKNLMAKPNDFETGS